MFLCQFDDNRLGLVENDLIRDVTSILDRLPSQRYPYPRCDVFIEGLAALRPAILDLAYRAPAIRCSKVQLLSPVANPGKVIGAPVNYAKHLEEARIDPGLHHQNPAHLQPVHQIGLFLKATSSVIGPSHGVVIQHPERRTDHEVELAVIIGKRAKSIFRADALSYVAGYCIGLDITVRGAEERSLRKSIDTYTVLGPWMVTSDELLDPSQLTLSLSVNGDIRQKGYTRDLILDVAELIEFASSFYTLYPGDVLLSGTPEGVGPINSGDVMVASIDVIGDMEVKVRAA